MVLSPTKMLKVAVIGLSLVLASASNLRMDSDQQHRQLAAANTKQPPAPFPFIAAEAPDYNNKVIGAMLRQSMHLRAPSDGYAVFSWDETVMAGNLMETLLYYQAETVNYRIPPTRIHEVFSLGYNDGDVDECLPLGLDTVIWHDDNSGVDWTPRLLRQVTVHNYQWLYEAYIGLTFNYVDPNYAAPPIGPFGLQQVHDSYEYQAFRQSVFWLWNSLQRISKEHPNTDCGQRLDALAAGVALTGMNEDEVRSLTRAAVNWSLSTKLRMETIAPGAMPFTTHLQVGLRRYNGQLSMVRALRLHHVDIYVVADIPHVVLTEAATMPALGFRFAKEKLYGTRYELDGEGKMTMRVAFNESPVPVRAAKRYIVDTMIRPKHNGRAPLFVSGATDADCEMLLAAVDHGIAHMVNTASTPNGASCLQYLKDLACSYYGQTEGSTNTWYLLQGINNQWGSWVPSGFSSIDGGDYAPGSNYDCSSYNFKQ